MTSRVPQPDLGAPPPRVVWLLDFLLLGFILNLTFQPLVEPDFGWHLRAGLDWLDQGLRLPDRDPYSHSMPEWRWVEHAWLTDGIVVVVYRAFGSGGVILLFGAVAAAAWWIASGASPVVVPRTYRLAAMAIGLWVALPFLGARTQLVSLLGIAILLRLWRDVQQGAVCRLWWLPPLFLLWANLHGGFTAGLVLLTIFLSGAFAMQFAALRLPRLVRKSEEPLPAWEPLVLALLMLGAAAAVTLVNPYGLRLHLEIYDSLTDRFMLDTLREWQPVSFDGWAGRAYGAYLAGLALLVIGWYRRVEPVRWMVLAVMLGLSLRHWRNVTLFLVVSAPLCAELLMVAVQSAVRRVPGLNAHATAALAAMSLLVAGTVILFGVDHVRHLWRAAVDSEASFEATEYPIEAVRWIRGRRAEVGSRLYNDYGHGGFLLWHLPSEKIFIDGRMPAWRIKDRRIFRDYVDLNRPDAPALEVLDRYRIDWAIVPRETALAQALQSHPAWKQLYADAKVIILRR